MNFPFKRLKDREHVPAKEWNKLCDILAQLLAESKTTRDDIQQAAQAEPLLARIVDRETYESGQSPVYSWVAVRQDDEGNHAQHPIAMRGDADGYPAYEEHGNPLVPIDGTAVVELRLGPGPYYLFSYKPREVWAKITGSSGALYAWTEVYHAGGTTFSTLTGGRTGATSVNAARERNGVTGIANDTIVELRRGHCDGAPRVIVTRQQVGNDDDEREIQQVRILDATGGTFTLTFDGQTTSALAYDINAADLEAALEALSTVTACSVTGTGTDGDPFVITFEDDYEEHAFMTPDATAMKSDQEWLFDNPTPWDALPNTSVTLGTSQNDYSLTQTMTYIDASSAINITGFAAPSGGGATLRLVKNTNATNSITFKHQSGSSSSGNKIYNPDAGDYVIGPHQTGGWIYDPVGLQWQPLWTPAAKGIYSLNALTGATQTFAVGTSGTDFAISSSGTTHTFNLPSASTSNRGALTVAAQTVAGGKTFDAASVTGVSVLTAKQGSSFDSYLECKDSGGALNAAIGLTGSGGMFQSKNGGYAIWAGASGIGDYPASSFQRDTIPAGAGETGTGIHSQTSSGASTETALYLDPDNERVILMAQSAGSYTFTTPVYAIREGATVYDGATGTSGGGDTVKGGIITALGSGTAIADGDKGDITTSSSGTVWTIDNDAVTYAKIQNVSATDKILGRVSTGAGDIEEITFTDQAQQLCDDTSFSAMRTTLGVAYGSSAGTVCEGNDSRLTDSRTPTAHKTSHQSGGSDAIKLDDLAAPDDNTDLNASTSAHGLLKKLDNNAAHFLDGQGNWSTPSTGTADTGTVSMFAMAVPSGWLECDGAAVSRSTYSALFSAIGTVWGSGDGSTTFNVPDLRGRAPIGVGTGVTLTARNLGTIGGAENHTLSTSELPSHTHQPSGDAVLRYTGLAGSYSLPAAGTDVVLNITIPNTGSGSAHNNMQPWAALRFGIKT